MGEFHETFNSEATANWTYKSLIILIFFTNKLFLKINIFPLSCLDNSSLLLILALK